MDARPRHLPAGRRCPCSGLDSGAARGVHHISRRCLGGGLGCVDRHHLRKRPDRVKWICGAGVKKYSSAALLFPRMGEQYYEWPLYSLFLTMNEFIHFHPAGLDCCTLDTSEFADGIPPWCCSGCHTPKPDVGVVHIRIQEKVPPSSPFSFVQGAGLVMIKKDFLEKLNPEYVAADLLIGSVDAPSGEKISNWVTVRGRHRVIVRGTKNITYRRCDICGRQLYFAQGQRYLFPTPPGNVSIFESVFASLIIRRNAFDGELPKRQRGLGIERLEVFAAPKDGLGELT